MNRVWMLAALSMAGIGSCFAAGDVELDAGALNPSERCGSCHAEIYAMWQRSLHHGAVDDPIFEASYLQAYRETAGQARELCLRCHAPVAVANGDLELRDPLSREGVTCDFCHSIEAVNLEDHEHPLRLVLDGVKRGPLRDSVSPAHAVARSALHESAEFCAGCHEYTNRHGLAVLTTYSEWKESSHAAAGRTCQQCHMPLTSGDTVRAGAGEPTRASINLHDISGGHSREQVQKAATVKILRVEPTNADTALVEVEVCNVGSGHRIPTGMPTRRLILDVTLYSGGRLVHHFERHYQRVVVDEAGDILVDDHRVLMDGRRILEDTRLLPGERRRERFVAGNPGGVLRAEARLRYTYEPKIVMRKEMSIEMARDELSSRP